MIKNQEVYCKNVNVNVKVKQENLQFIKHKEKLFQSIMDQHCVNGFQAKFLCSEICEQDAAICGESKCSCKQRHQLCAKLDLQSFNKSLLKNVRDPHYTIEKIDKIFDQMTNMISQTQNTLINIFKTKNYGLNKAETNYVNILNQKQLKTQEKQNAKITGSSIKQILDERYVPRSIQIKVLIKELQNIVQQNKQKVLVEYQNLKAQIFEVWFRENPQIFQESKIIQDYKDRNFLLSCFQQSTKLYKTNLLYRASDYNFSTNDFEIKCHNCQNLLFLVKNQNKKVYGGFTPCKYSKNQSQVSKSDGQSKSFLFSLNDRQRFKLLNKQYAFRISNTQSNLILFGQKEYYSMSLSLNSNKISESSFYPHRDYQDKEINYGSQKLLDFQVYTIN